MECGLRHQQNFDRYFVKIENPFLGLPSRSSNRFAYGLRRPFQNNVTPLQGLSENGIISNNVTPRWGLNASATIKLNYDNHDYPAFTINRYTDILITNQKRTLNPFKETTIND